MRPVLYLAAALFFTSCGTSRPQISEQTRARLDAALARLATASISIGEAAVAAQLTRLATKVTPSK